MVSVDSLQLAAQQQSAATPPMQQRHPPREDGGNQLSSPSEAAALERVRAEAARLAADNAALRGRLSRTHRLVGAMQVLVLPLGFAGFTKRGSYFSLCMI